MAEGDLQMHDVISKHDETLFGSTRYNTIAPDVYTRPEVNELLNEKADITDLDDYYSKSQTFAKDEVYTRLKQISYSEKMLTKLNQLLDEKADETDLANYVTLGTSQTITANKNFQNSCRFISTKDGMATDTGSSSVKSGVDETIVLLGAGGTKPIAEFGGCVDDSNYVKKTGQATQSITGKLIRKDSTESFGNLEIRQYTAKYNMEGAFVKKTNAKYGFVQKQGQQVQEIEVKLRRKQDDEESEDGDYLAKEEMDKKYISPGEIQTITGAKTITISVTAPAFVKYSGTNQQVLLAD
ncbi:MAG: hypothetical protein EZS28_016456 [Streblomastix strix]|uniref:Uncharacterized protein n=1 Tax=Streblomastix strix TaxID=222440 RepID=A0A5J4VZB1_9EUKA|nr:MAG: hypothetical protein EZS28_016456 [Streblomastix strix]